MVTLYSCPELFWRGIDGRRRMCAGGQLSAYCKDIVGRPVKLIGCWCKRPPSHHWPADGCRLIRRHIGCRIPGHDMATRRESAGDRKGLTVVGNDARYVVSLHTSSCGASVSTSRSVLRVADMSALKGITPIPRSLARVVG